MKYDDKDIFFDRQDCDTWVMSRMLHKLLLQIRESPLCQVETIPDIPLAEEQMIAFTKGYTPD